MTAKKAAGAKSPRAKPAVPPPALKNPASDKPGLILDAALDLFRQHGYRRTSMEDIANAANVAKGTLYIYFKSKDELFEGLARRLSAQIAQDVKAALARKLPFEDKVLAVLDAKLGFVYRWVLSSPHASELTDPTSQLPDDVFGPVDQALRASLADLFKTEVKAGKIDLKGAGLTPETAVDTLLAAAHGAEMGATGEEHFHERLTRIGRLTLRGLRSGL
ncbi:MAG: TetR/AcrR family transcriptional regulator [Parvibaculum sp.]|nr:TetR/AcrR family transcriptional regulator [Parvibaculum sp.]